MHSQHRLVLARKSFLHQLSRPIPVMEGIKLPGIITLGIVAFLACSVGVTVGFFLFVQELAAPKVEAVQTMISAGCLVLAFTFGFLTGLIRFPR